MTVEELSPITLTFKKPEAGWWDGGKKSGGVFTPSLHYQDDPTRSFVRWGCYELNHWINLPLHTKRGRTLTKGEVMARIRKHLKRSVRRPCVIR
jgi:hypothetical protein